ncbi:leukocyte antigen CD37-like isoform X1 [Maniola hyperantus]|uniref:leukocyte antigen CD37-like isoform X1 n=1 Tax=Aphantopus hyperantus TaxID=2795564 RepID=UPI002132606C
MGMSRCYSMMKCLLIMFNVIFLSVGVGVCAFVSWALWDGRGAEGGAGRAGLCALGLWAVVLALGAIAALAGAIRGSASLLAAAFALLALSAVAEAAAAWWGAAHQPQLQQLECCGVESARDWQQAAWARATGELDLSVQAPATYYWVPASCCTSTEEVECALARRVPAASGGGAGLHAAPCAPRVLGALRGAARAPLVAGAALLAAHGAALLLALALCLRAQPDTRYKA